MCRFCRKDGGLALYSRLAAQHPGIAGSAHPGRRPAGRSDCLSQPMGKAAGLAEKAAFALYYRNCSSPSRQSACQDYGRKKEGEVTIRTIELTFGPERKARLSLELLIRGARPVPGLPDKLEPPPVGTDCCPQRLSRLFVRGIGRQGRHGKLCGNLGRAIRFRQADEKSLRCLQSR